ncbi:MAG TPA: CBS domain-containing protein [Acetobacteraceae bacterium]|jgi:CBS domain-containing protein|nr:CBS domain-containing protein [Acetobacteraceae bacterium]
MRAADVMTANVITVEPDTTVQALAILLSERAISGAPVVDAAGRLVGIVSEGDLLHRIELGTDATEPRKRSWWLEDFAAAHARDYVKAHGRTVADIMTRDVVVVTEQTDLGEVATLLETNRIKRVPVMRGETIVGIISRSNLVRALGAAHAPAVSATSEDDRIIRAKLFAELQKQDWGSNIWAQDIIVNGAVVHLWFTADEAHETREAARVAAESIPGVRGVEVHIAPSSMVAAF